MVAMRDVSATEAALIYGLEPVWGATFAWFLLGERWGLLGWIGAVFVIGEYGFYYLLGSISYLKICLSLLCFCSRAILLLLGTFILLSFQELACSLEYFSFLILYKQSLFRQRLQYC